MFKINHEYHGIELTKMLTDENREWLTEKLGPPDGYIWFVRENIVYFANEKRSSDVFTEMCIRIQPEETYNSWSNRVCMHEFSMAKRQIDKGIPVDQVLECMSKNITKKLLHPLLKIITDIPNDLDKLAASKKLYEDSYMIRAKPIADQVDD